MRWIALQAAATTAAIGAYDDASKFERVASLPRAPRQQHGLKPVPNCAPQQLPPREPSTAAASCPPLRLALARGRLLRLSPTSSQVVLPLQRLAEKDELPESMLQAFGRQNMSRGELNQLRVQEAVRAWQRTPSDTGSARCRSLCLRSALCGSAST